MTINLPLPIANYFQFEKSDGRTVANCFSETACVTDEGQAYNGRAAIERWKDAAAAKYVYDCEPLAVQQLGTSVVVTCRLTGNFPGSPVDLRHIFECENQQITTLEIVV